MLADRLMRWLYHGHRAWCKLLILQVVVVWRGDLRWVNRCKTLSHHLTPLILFIAVVDLLEKARELLSSIHLLRLWYELLDFKRFTGRWLNAIRWSNLGVCWLFFTWLSLLWCLVHCHRSLSPLLYRLSCIQFIFHSWWLSMRCNLYVILINLESCKLTTAKDQLVLKKFWAILTRWNHSNTWFPGVSLVYLRLGEVDLAFLERLCNDLSIVFLGIERSVRA